MSTHCGIAIKTEEGYKTIYCHHDGYPKYMFKMLVENYNSEAWACKLVDAGDASFISEKFETDLPHSFDNPQYDTCCFYHRDRGEDWEDVKPCIYKTKQELRSAFYYAYVFDKGRWAMVSKSGDEIEYGEV